MSGVTKYTHNHGFMDNLSQFPKTPRSTKDQSKYWQEKYLLFNIDVTYVGFFFRPNTTILSTHDFDSEYSLCVFLKTKKILQRMHHKMLVVFWVRINAYSGVWGWKAGYGHQPELFLYISWGINPILLIISITFFAFESPYRILCVP